MPNPPIILIIPDHSTLEEYYNQIMQDLHDKYHGPSSNAPDKSPWHEHPEPPANQNHTTRADRIY